MKITATLVLFSALLVFAAPAANADSPVAAAPAAHASADPSTPEGAYLVGRRLAGKAAVPGAGPDAVEKQYAEVVKWYRKAANRGYAPAQYDLGELFYDGTVVKQDYKEAFKWFNKAAAQNVLAADFYVGLCYQLGLGVKRNDAEAYYWLSLANHRGWRVSQVLLDKSSQRLTPRQIEEIKKKVAALKPAPAPAASHQ